GPDGAGPGHAQGPGPSGPGPCGRPVRSVGGRGLLLGLGGRLVVGLLEALTSLLDEALGGLPALPALALGPLVGLEVLVALEEVLDLLELVLVDVVEALDVVVALVRGHAQDLRVPAGLVVHVEHGDGA